MMFSFKIPLIDLQWRVKPYNQTGSCNVRFKSNVNYRNAFDPAEKTEYHMSYGTDHLNVRALSGTNLKTAPTVTSPELPLYLFKSQSLPFISYYHNN